MNTDGALERLSTGSVTVTMQVKAVSAIHVQSPSDDRFAPYRKLIEELRELAAAEESKSLPGTVKR